MSHGRSRRRRQKRQRVDAEKLATYAAEIKELTNDIGELGINLEQALEIVAEGVHAMRARMVEAGAVTQAPWGQVFDEPSLRKTLQSSILMLQGGLDGIDQRGDAADLGEDESVRYMVGIIGGAVSAAAAGVLFIMSQPLPYKMARHLRAIDNPAE